MATRLPSPRPRRSGGVLSAVHIESAIFLTGGDAAIAGRRLFGIAANLARDRGIAEGRFRLATNTGRDATHVR
jgi:hypothetical protein